MKVGLFITGRGYDAAVHLPGSLELGEGAKVDDALRTIDALLAGKVRLAATCLVAVSGRHLGTLAQHENAPLADGDELVLIAPVAGG